MRVTVFTPPGTPSVPLPKRATPLSCRTLTDVAAEFGRSQLVCLDLRLTCPADLAPQVERWLTAHPFVPVVLVAAHNSVPAPISFRLGQLGVSRLLSVDDAMRVDVWDRILREYETVSLTTRFQQTVLPLIRRTAMPLMSVFLTYIQAPAVKQLVYRAPVSTAPTTDGKRRALLRQCRRHQLRSPEDVLFGLRLLFVKAALDDNTWTQEQLASYLEFSSPRVMWRSIQRRSGYTRRQLHHQPIEQVRTAVAHRFLWLSHEKASTPDPDAA